jgi:hypothetical protein
MRERQCSFGVALLVQYAQVLVGKDEQAQSIRAVWQEGRRGR